MRQFMCFCGIAIVWRPLLLCMLMLACSGLVVAADSPPVAANATPVAADDLLRQAQSLAAENPQAVVDLLGPVWQTSTPVQRDALALLLIEAQAALAHHPEVLALFDTLQAAKLSPEDERRLLAAAMQAATALRSAPAGESLMVRVEALAARGLSAEAMAQLWDNATGMQIQMGHFPQAEQSARKGLALLGDTPSRQLFALRRVLGVALVQQGRTPEAIESMLAAEQAAEGAGVPLDAGFLMNFGGMFIYAKEPARAISYLKRAEKRALDDAVERRRLPAIYNNLGTAEHGRGELLAAQRYFEQSVSEARAQGSSPSSGLNNLASILQTQGKLSAALASFEEVLALQRAASDRVGQAIALKNIGETLVMLEQRQRAAEFLEQAHAIQAELDNRPKRLELLPLMVDNLEALGRHDQALARMREFKTISDEVINADSKERMAKLQGAIDLAERDRELAASEVERVRQEAAIIELRTAEQRQRWLAWTLGAGVLGLSVVAALLVRAVRFRARANRALADKNHEIEAQRGNLQTLNELVRNQSLRDELTQLPNRRFLNEYMLGWEQRSQSTGAPGMLVLIIDIDDFKALNDQHGHLVGDQALVHLANLLREIQRGSDVLVRWGGEEFVWLCPDVGVAAASALCRRIRTQLHSRPLQLESARIAMTASIGYAPLPLWPHRTGDWHLSLRVADAALYCAKGEGKDRGVGFVGAATPVEAPLDGVSIEALIAAGNVRRAVEADT
ncbi:MAG: tetratricopeptide repeat-containing diguanylate cyclase [Pseudomarimonas sp.]